MKRNRAYGWFFWSVILLLSFISVLTLHARIQLFVPSFRVVYALMAAVVLSAWTLPLVILIAPDSITGLEQQFQQYRQRPIRAWGISLLYLILILLVWGVLNFIEGTIFFLLAYGYLLSVFWLLGSDAGEWHEIGRKLANNRLTNLMLLCTTILICFSAVELIFRMTTVVPFRFGVSAQHIGWVFRYWEPLNSSGERAYEPRAASDEERSILVLGDSFAVGHGINDIDDVFAYRLQDLLGDSYVVNLTGQPGLSPGVENLQAYLIEPDILILSHYMNDIDHVIEGTPPQLEALRQSGFGQWITKNYYFPSFVYWQVYIYSRLASDQEDLLLGLYAEEDSWSAHQEHLQQMVDWAQERDIQLVILLWPYMHDVDSSLSANDRVASFFEEQGILVVRMRSYLQGLSLDERIVNNFDTHPSVHSHQLAAEALADVIQNLADD